MQTTIVRTLILLTVGILLNQPNLQAAKAISTTFFGNKAASGYDVVAYHTQEKAVPGKKSYTTNWNGATWLFSTAKNRQLFIDNPNKYAPQYGGYCAFAAAANKLVKADPKIFDLHEGKLYLNYNKKTKKDWNADRAGMIQRGNRNYPQLIAK